MVVEEKAKQYIRLFRRNLKKIFDDLHDRKHYHWIDSKVRIKTTEFFTEQLNIPDITYDFYKKNECSFFKLLHPTIKVNQTRKSKRADKQEPWFEVDEYQEVYNLVFGQHPSKENLNKFFANPIIKILW